MSPAKPQGFEELTPRGQQGRLRALALDALRQYEIDVARCSFAARAFNSVFRVDATDGSAYALRMSPALRIHADGCEAAEAAWVAALRRDTNVSAPAVITARDGLPVVTASSAGVAEPRSCVVFEWVPGRRLRDRMSAAAVHKVGAILAAVHEHGAAYASEPPPGVLVADQVLYFRAEPRLDELRPASGSLLTDAVARAQVALDDLWHNPPHRPHILHGDVQPGNVMVSSAEVVLIDFQDLIWGFEAQDVGFALQSLNHFGDSSELRAALRSGYESVRPWPEVDPVTAAALAAARHLNILNFGLSVSGPDRDAFITRHTAPIAAWMRSEP